MRLSTLILLLFASIVTLGQKRDYIQFISDLLVLYYDNPEIKEAEDFKDSVIQVQPCPIENRNYRELITTYIDRTHDKNLSFGQSDITYYLALATSFNNDTINQLGFIRYMEFALANSEIDTVAYHQLADSIQRNSLHNVIPEVLRNQAYRLRLSTQVPDFVYELLNGEKVQISKMKEGYLLFEFPLPTHIPEEHRPKSAKRFMKDFPNLLVLRTTMGVSQAQKESDFLSSFYPKNLDFLMIQGSPADDFFKMRSSPRWILINKKLEIMSSDFDLRKDEMVQNLKNLLEEDLNSSRSD